MSRIKNKIGENEIFSCGCPVCGRQNVSLLCRSKDYITKRVFSLVKCLECRIVFTFPLLSREEIKSFYPKCYYRELKLPLNFLLKFLIGRFEKKKINSIIRCKKVHCGSLLDVGCGRGHVLGWFGSKGWTTCGTELSEVSSEFARKKLNLNIFLGEVEEANHAPDSFDVVTCWHVLEHLKNPDKTLREIYRITKAGGVAIIAVPNISSLQAGLFGEKWFHLDLPRHYYHFSPATLGNLLEAAGFRIIKKKFFSLEYDFFGWLQSLLNIPALQFNFLWDFLTRRAGVLDRLPVRNLFINLVVNMVLVLPLGVLSVFLTFLLAPFKGGATMIFFVRKP